MLKPTVMAQANWPRALKGIAQIHDLRKAEVAARERKRARTGRKGEAIVCGRWTWFAVCPIGLAGALWGGAWALEGLGIIGD